MLILNPTDFHWMDKHSWNIFLNIFFYVRQKKLSEKTFWVVLSNRLITFKIKVCLHNVCANTQSRSSLTSYAIACSISQINRIRLWTRYRVACQWTTALCNNCRSIWKQVMEIYHQSRSRLYWRDVHVNRMRLIAQPKYTQYTHIM